MVNLFILLICNMIVPLIMTIFGFIIKNHPPKKINGIYGYRTSSSMKNNETWEFANKLCGIIWKKVGIIMIIVTLVVTVISLNFSDSVQGIICAITVSIQTVVLIVTIFPVEKALNKNFDKDGNRL